MGFGVDSCGGGRLACLLQPVAIVVNGALSFLVPTRVSVLTKVCELGGYVRVETLLRSFKQKGCYIQKKKSPIPPVPRLLQEAQGRGICGVGCGPNSQYNLFSYHNGRLGYM
jgi:hypothetical protein